MPRYLTLFTTFAVFAGSCSLALAQPAGMTQGPGLKASVSVVGINQFNTNLNSGGSFGWSYASASLGLLNNISPVTTVGMSFRYETEFWNWSNMQAYNLGGKSPWGTIQSPGVSAIYSHKFDSDWRLNLIPTIESNAEQGAELGNSLTYGAVVNASKQLSPALNLGLGTAVFRQIDTNRIFPFIVINWKITDRWNLNNPLPGGPAGGAGLELSYAVTPQFKISGGAAYRSYRFRLSNSSAYAGGVGQNKFIPIFARFSYAFDRTTLLDLYAVANVGGSVSAIDTSGNTVLTTSYKTAPAIALSLVKRF